MDNPLIWIVAGAALFLYALVCLQGLAELFGQLPWPAALLVVVVLFFVPPLAFIAFPVLGIIGMIREHKTREDAS